MSGLVRKPVVVAIVVVALLSARSTIADGQPFYESLPDVSIGKVFFSPQQRARLDQRRGSTPAVASSIAAPGGVRKKVHSDAAGFIQSSDGTSKVYTDGDFVNDHGGVAVKFPGSVKIIRKDDPDEAEASDEAD